MKRTPLSLKIRNLPAILSPNSGLTHILLEAADSLEHHEKEIEQLNERLRAADIRYANLFKNRKQLIEDFRIGFILCILTTAVLTTLVVKIF